MRWNRTGALLATAVAAAGAVSCRSAGGTPLELELAAFERTDDDAWRVTERRGPGGGALRCLELVGPSDYAPPHRSPLSIALVRGRVLADFVLEARLLQTGREYGHRDLCLFFGHQDPAHFYYVHLATTPDDRAHNVFLVDGADRRRIAPVPAEGVHWGDGVWHEVRLERTLGDGRIRVWFDGSLVLDATDRTLGAGRVGFGSFDDTGAFADVRLSGG